MHKGITFVTILVVLLGACASGKDTAQSAAERQTQDTMKNSNAGQNAESSARAREV
jgi:predicted kinase